VRKGGENNRRGHSRKHYEDEYEKKQTNKQKQTGENLYTSGAAWDPGREQGDTSHSGSFQTQQSFDKLKPVRQQKNNFRRNIT